MNKREKASTLYFYLLISLSLLLTFAGNAESRSLNLPQNSFETLGFYTGDEPGLPSSENSVLNHARNLTFIAPFYFRIQQNGKGIEKWNDTTTTQIKNTVVLAHNKNIKVLALVHNLLYGDSEISKQAAHQVLKDAGSRKRFTAQALKLVTGYGFDGINLDIENIYPSDKNNLGALVHELKNTFSEANLMVTVCVPPKTLDFSQDQWGQNFDYREIGKWADRVIVMAYDQHGYSTGPGPIASLPWVRDVISYSTSVIPKNKILLGVPAYGFDWTEDQVGHRYLSYQSAMETAKEAGTVPVFNRSEHSPHFDYQINGVKHHVWFEDTRSFKDKVSLAKQWGLQGIAIWRLGMEDPGIWNS